VSVARDALVALSRDLTELTEAEERCDGKERCSGERSEPAAMDESEQEMEWLVSVLCKSARKLLCASWA
jgi:hypothetical protein